jgi:NAD+ synthase
MLWEANPLKHDPEETYHHIAKFIQSHFRASKRQAILIGLSGGLDSAVVAYLCTKSLGADQIRLINMPERDSKSIHQRDAQRIADALGIELETRDLTTVLDAFGIYSSLPIGILPTRSLRAWLVKFGKSISGLNRESEVLTRRLKPMANSWVAKGNAYASAKHRMRMVMLYHLADTHNTLVAGAANKTEWLTGTFSKWGCDQCADIMPIVHLYRSQLPALAHYLEIPEAIRSKAADPDVMPGIDNKEKLLGSFEVIDQILWALENNIARNEIRRKFGDERTEFALSLLEHSRHMRESPYSIRDSGEN